MAQHTFIKGCIFLITRARVISIALLLAWPIWAADEFGEISANLRKSDLKTRYEALEKIKIYRTPQAAAVLAQSAIREKDTNFRLAVLDQVAVLGYADTVPRLAPLLRDKNVSVRQRTARVVSMLGGSGAEDVLLDAFRTESDHTVKAALAQGLSLCGSAKSLDALNAAANEKDPAIRANSKYAIERMRRTPPMHADQKKERKGK